MLAPQRVRARSTPNAGKNRIVGTEKAFSPYGTGVKSYQKHSGYGVVLVPVGSMDGLAVSARKAILRNARRRLKPRR